NVKVNGSIPLSPTKLLRIFFANAKRRRRAMVYTDEVESNSTKEVFDSIKAHNFGLKLLNVCLAKQFPV
ncbi:MAG TPA: hypothetical protein VIK81_00405, partial [Patescibacteria group bacterium]